MKVSIIIPVYNEEKTIKEVIERVAEADILGMEKEIIVVDDGSSDTTREVLASLRRPLKVICKERNEGKGSALRAGMREAQGDIILIQDADLEYDPSDYQKILQPIASGLDDVVYGSRNIEKNPASSFFFYWGGRFITEIANILYGASLTDLPTCYKVFRKDVIAGIEFKEKGFEFCEELTAKLLKRGYDILEVPISYTPRGKKEGKKLRWTHGLRAIRTLMRERFSVDHKDFNVLDIFIRSLREKKVVPNIPKDARMLDIGCADGHFIISQSPRIREGIGIDPFVTREIHLGKIKILPQSVEDIASYHNNSFDIATMLAVLEHLDDPKKALRECWRVLSRNGLLLLTTPSLKAEGILHILAQIGMISRKEIEDHKRHFSKEELMRILEEAGFLKEDITIEPFEFGYNYFVKARKARKSQ